MRARRRRRRLRPDRSARDAPPAGQRTTCRSFPRWTVSRERAAVQRRRSGARGSFRRQAASTHSPRSWPCARIRGIPGGRRNSATRGPRAALHPESGRPGVRAKGSRKRIERPPRPHPPGARAARRLRGEGLVRPGGSGPRRDGRSAPAPRNEVHPKRSAKGGSARVDRDADDSAGRSEARRGSPW